MDNKDSNELKLIKEIKLKYCDESIKIYGIPNDIKPTKEAMEEFISNKPKERVTGSIFNNVFEFPRLIQTF